MPNRFYLTFYTPQPMHLDAYARAVAIFKHPRGQYKWPDKCSPPIQTIPIHAAKDWEEVYITPFPTEYCLPMFVIYRGIPPLQHL